MPLTYFNCKKGQVSIKDCLEYCQDRCLALSHLYAIADQREWKGQASVTQLIKGTREAYLLIVSDYAVKPDDMAFMLYGTLHHKRLEIINKKLEGLSEKTIKDETLSGTLDRLEPDEMNQGFYKLLDYKLCGAYSVISDKRDWQLQLNRYRLLVETNPELKNLFPISRMFIQATLRDSGLKQMNKLGLTNRMPMIPIAKMDDIEVFYYFHDKEIALQNALAKKELPPMCDYTESWASRKCKKHCQANAYCREGAMLAKIKYLGE